MALDVRQFREVVVRPALRALGPEFASESAEQLLLGTAAVETNFRWLKQVRGPAVGLFQVEPATYRDIFERYLGSPERDDLRLRVLSLASRGGGEVPEPSEMAWNLRFAAALCRVYYWRLPDRLPAPLDVRGFARLWKAKYNTPAGKGTEEHFVRAWTQHVSPIL